MLKNSKPKKSKEVAQTNMVVADTGAADTTVGRASYVDYEDDRYTSGGYTFCAGIPVHRVAGQRQQANIHWASSYDVYDTCVSLS